MGRKYFGTDGIRGKVGEFPITPEFVLKLGWAAGRVLARGENDKVVIGKDTRISGYMFESALEAGLSAAGVDILLLGPMPTPAVAYLTRTLHAAAGIVISASHNPFEDNGIKFFSADGTKLPDEVELAIEAELDSVMSMAPPAALGKARRIVDAGGRYIEFCKSTFPNNLNLKGLKLVLDCANGATYHVAPSVFRELGAKVTTLGDQPDGLNINVDCGSTHPQRLQAAVAEQGADLGIAFDGDGDRLGVVDSSGRLIWPDRVLMYLAMDVLTREPGGDIIYDVKCSRHLANVILSNGGRPLMWKSGHSNLKSKMRETHALLAGEFSGHIMFSERWYGFDDGIYAGARLLEILSLDYRASAEIFAELPDSLATPEYALRLEEGRAQAVMQSIEQLPDLPGARLVKIDGLRAEFEQGWGLVRASNTTPALLFRFESDSQAGLEQVQSIFRDLLSKVAPDLEAPF